MLLPPGQSDYSKRSDMHSAWFHWCGGNALSHTLFILVTMTTNTFKQTRSTQPQLLLINSVDQSRQPWALDDETRATGRRGLAKARAALQATRPAHLDIAA